MAFIAVLPTSRRFEAPHIESVSTTHISIAECVLASTNSDRLQRKKKTTYAASLISALHWSTRRLTTGSVIDCEIVWLLEL